MGRRFWECTMKRTVALPLLLGTLLFAHSAYGVTIISASRSVMANDGIDPGQSISSSSTSGIFNHSLNPSFTDPGGSSNATAAQNTNIGPFGFSGTGSADFDCGSLCGSNLHPVPSADSSFAVAFTVTVPTELTGSVSLDGLFAAFSVSGIPDGSVFESLIALNAPQGNHLFDIVLVPGSWGVAVDTGTETGDFDFNVSLGSQTSNGVPEPGTLLLTAAGACIAILLARFRHRRSRRPADRGVRG
jgi:hypothetical protein